MKFSRQKLFLVLLLLAIIAAAITAWHNARIRAILSGGGGAQVVTPVLGSAGSGQCFGAAVGYAYDNPNSPKTPWAIPNWPAGGNCITLTFTPTPPAVNGYVLKAGLTWDKPTIPPTPHNQTCSASSSLANGSLVWTYTWNYVPSNVYPELLVMARNGLTNLGSISFKYSISTVKSANTP